MLRFIGRILVGIITPLPGWMFVISGMAMVGMAVLVPAWVDSRQLQWRLDLMRAQTHTVVAQRDHFRQFNQALANDDPILLERLAYYHLRLRPEGATSLDNTPAVRPVGNRVGQAPAGPLANRPGVIPALANRPPAMRTPSIEEMLEAPLPQPGVDFPPYRPIDTRLVRITTGKLRLPLIAAGILAIVAGLFLSPSAPPTDLTDDEETQETTDETEDPVDDQLAETDSPEPEGKAPAAISVRAPIDAVTTDADEDDDAPFNPVVDTADEAPLRQSKPAA